MLNRICKICFFLFIVRPIVLFLLGLNVKYKENLPQSGPAVIAANHNSHLDTMVLMSLYPLAQLHKLRPVAAADYFLSNRLLAWFSLNIIGIIPIFRSGEADRDTLFTQCHHALDRGEILILFPEGSRGKPEQISKLKKGIYYLVSERDDTQITPVVMHGLGRALPRGEALLVPFNCDVVIGEPLAITDDANQMVEKLSLAFSDLQRFCLTRNTLD